MSQRIELVKGGNVMASAPRPKEEEIPLTLAKSSKGFDSYLYFSEEEWNDFFNDKTIHRKNEITKVEEDLNKYYYSASKTVRCIWAVLTPKKVVYYHTYSPAGMRYWHQKWNTFEAMYKNVPKDIEFIRLYR